MSTYKNDKKHPPYCDCHSWGSGWILRDLIFYTSPSLSRLISIHGRWLGKLVLHHLIKICSVHMEVSQIVYKLCLVEMAVNSKICHDVTMWRSVCKRSKLYSINVSWYLPNNCWFSYKFEAPWQYILFIWSTCLRVQWTGCTKLDILFCRVPLFSGNWYIYVSVNLVFIWRRIAIEITTNITDMSWMVYKKPISLKLNKCTTTFFH